MSRIRSIIVAEERITYTQYVFVDLGIQHAARMRYILICVLQGSAIFFHMIS